MSMVHPTAGTDRLAPACDQDEMLQELSRFFKVALDGSVTAGMFSAGVDAVWHNAIQQADWYRAFCLTAVGRVVGHVPGGGTLVYGVTGSSPAETASGQWVKQYEERFGPLPRTWFTDANGIVDKEAYERYVSTGVIVASWECSPAFG